MANDLLKQSVDNTIFENINNLIKAADHNPMLKQLIQTLGLLQYKGKAEESTTPSASQLDTNFFYLAEEGTYQNLGNITVNIGEVAFISYSEGAYSKSSFSASGGSGGNTFSDQFRLLQDIVYWDPSYIANKYAASGGITEDIYVITADSSQSDPNYIWLFYPNIDTPPVNEKIRFDFDIMLDTNNGVSQNLLRTRSQYAIDGGGTLQIDSPTVAETLDNTWKSISFEVSTDALAFPPDKTLSAIFCHLVNNAGSTTIGTGSVFKIRRLKVYNETGDELDHTGITIPVLSNTLTIEQEVVSALNGTRVQHLNFLNTGEVPTVPSDNDLRPGDTGWLATDIMEGEISFNIPDKKVFWRSGNDIIEFGSGGGGGNKAITQTPINITVNGTTAIPIDTTVKTLLFTDGVTQQGFTFSNLSDTEEFTATRIFDNTANNDAVVLMWPTGYYWDDSVPATGYATFAALSKYEMNVFVRSSTIARIQIIPLA